MANAVKCEGIVKFWLRLYNAEFSLWILNSVISLLVLIKVHNFSLSSIRLITQQINRSKGKNEELRLFWKTVG